jgi:intracellular sulfur oxidation DsrE/DsrF family protein
MTTSLRALFRSLVVAIGLLTAWQAWAGDKVVYHIDDAQAQATKALRSIRNHLDVAPDTKIVVVALADGVQFLREGAVDQKNNGLDYGALVNALRARGVSFEICEITIQGLGLKKDQFSMDAEFVPSGVVRITQLQAKQGYAYIKP